MDIHCFDNGIKIYKHHLIPVQEQRYANVNLHEPTEEECFLTILDRISPTGIFFDIGSAVGYYSLLARRKLPKLQIHAFEPLELHQSYLRENFILNGFTPEGVTIHSEALAAKKGQAKFSVQHYESALFLKKPFSLKRTIRNIFTKTKARQSKLVNVKTITLDDILKKIQQPIE